MLTLLNSGSKDKGALILCFSDSISLASAPGTYMQDPNPLIISKVICYPLSLKVSLQNVQDISHIETL